jgi:hypothetical protein
MEFKEWTLGKQPERVAKRTCPSSAKLPVWQLLLMDFDLESPSALQALRRCAQTLFQHTAEGRRLSR